MINHKHSINMFIFLFAQTTLTVSACDMAETQKPKPAGTIRIGLAAQPTCALLAIAEARDFYEEEGLNVVTTTYPSGKRALHDGLLAGNEDIVNVADVPVALKAFEKADMLIVGTIGHADTIQKVIARRDAGITVPEDLRGKNIATQKGSAVHFFLAPVSPNARCFRVEDELSSG